MPCFLVKPLHNGCWKAPKKGMDQNLPDFLLNIHKSNLFWVNTNAYPDFGMFLAHTQGTPSPACAGLAICPWTNSIGADSAELGKWVSSTNVGMDVST